MPTHIHLPSDAPGITTEGSGVPSYAFLQSVDPITSVAPVVALRHHDPSDRVVLIDVIGDMETAAAHFPKEMDWMTRSATDMCESPSTVVPMNPAGLPKATRLASPLMLEDGCSLSLCLGTARHDNTLSAVYAVANRSAVEAEALWSACMYFLMSTHLEDRGRSSPCGVLAQRGGSIVTGVYCTRNEPMAAGWVDHSENLPRGCTKSSFTFGLIMRAHPNEPALQMWVDEWVTHLQLRLTLLEADARRAHQLLTKAMSAPAGRTSKWKSVREQRKLQKASALGVMGRGEAPTQEAGLLTFATAISCILALERGPCVVLPSLPVPFCASARSDRLTMFWEPSTERLVPNTPIAPVSLIYTSALNQHYCGGSIPAGCADVGLFPLGSRAPPHYSEVYSCARIGLLRPVDQHIGGSPTYDFGKRPVLSAEVSGGIREEGAALRLALMGPNHITAHTKAFSLFPSSGNPSRATTIGRAGISHSAERADSSASPAAHDRDVSPHVEMIDTPRGGSVSSSLDSPQLASAWSSTAAEHEVSRMPSPEVALACSPPNKSKRLSCVASVEFLGGHESCGIHSGLDSDAPHGPPQWRAVKPATRKLTFNGLSLPTSERYVMSGYMAPSFLYEPFVAPLSVHLPMFAVSDPVL